LSIVGEQMGASAGRFEERESMQLCGEGGSKGSVAKPRRKHSESPAPFRMTVAAVDLAENTPCHIAALPIETKA
jgi:hypothetical protein